MASPRQGLNPTTNSVGFTAKLVTVRSVSADGATAVVVDRQNTQTTVSMLVQRSKGPLPAPGDTWLISQDLGMWTFAAFVGTSGSQSAGGGSGGSEAGPDDGGGGSGGQVTVAPEPPESPAVDDIWMDSANGNQVSSWNGSAWIPAQFGAAALAPQSVTAAQMALATLTSAQLAANAGITAAQVAFTAAQIGGSRIFTGTAQPSGMVPGDLWFNAGNGNAVSVWTGQGWDSLLFSAPAIAPGSLTGAQLSQAAGIAASQVNFTATDIGGTTVSIQALEPSSPSVGDLWYDSTNGYVLKQWNGSQWALYQYGTGAIAAGSVTADLIAAHTITAAELAAGIVYAGIIDGTVIIGAVFEGDNWIEDSAGSFYYLPGTSQLAFSIAPGSGTDPLGASPYNSGFWVYNASGGGGAALITISGIAGLVIPPAGTTHANLPPQVTGFAGNTGLANEYVGLQLNSGVQKAVTGNTFVDLFSETNDATTGARGSLGVTGVEVIGWNSSNMTVTTGGGIKGNPAITLYDNTIDNNPNNGTQPCTMQWPIPAGDAKAGTIYEIETPFVGVTATSGPQALGFKPSLNGTAVTTSNGDTIGGAAMPAVTGFTGKMRLTMKVQTTGTSGTVDIYMEGGYAQEANIQAGSSTNSGFLSSQATGVAFNTEIANTIAIDTAWAVSSAGQTVSARGSVFTRKGP